LVLADMMVTLTDERQREILLLEVAFVVGDFEDVHRRHIAPSDAQL
jgi:hypothetical protein